LAALTITAGFAAIVAAAAPAVFLSHLVNDQLLYFVMAKNVGQHGTPIVSMAENLPPFTYAFGVAYIYAGVFKLFSLYEHQIRGIQAINLTFIFIYMLLTLRYMVRVVPQFPVFVIAGFCGSATLLDSRWHYIAVMPNSDIVPALVTIAAIVVARPIFQPEDRSRPAVNVAARTLVVMALGGIGLFVKMSLVTLPLALVFLLAMDRQHRIGWTRLLLVVAVLVGIGALFALNGEVAATYVRVLIQHHVFPDGDISVWGFGTSLVNWTANLAFSALPNFIIPKSRHFVFNEIAFPTNAFQTEAYTGPVIFGMGLGAAITSTMVVGAMRLWSRCRFEFVCLLFCLPVFMLLPDSTARYLIAFQPLIWASFFAGLAHRLPVFLAQHRVVMVAGATLTLVVFLFFQAISLRSRSQSDIGQVAYLREVGGVYQGVLDQLRSLPQANTRLIYFDERPISTGMWRASTEIPLYAPDANLPHIASKYHTLVVLTCVTQECELLDQSRQYVFDTISKTGKFDFTLLFRSESTAARAEIYAVRQFVN
jgi:hypothetical protein